MFKYIKWELIDEFRRKKLLAAFVAIVYLLVLITPGDATLMRYLIIPITIILCGSLLPSVRHRSIKFAIVFIFKLQRGKTVYNRLGRAIHIEHDGGHIVVCNCHTNQIAIAVCVVIDQLVSFLIVCCNIQLSMGQHWNEQSR